MPDVFAQLQSLSAAAWRATTPPVPEDPELVDACGDDASSFCEWVYESTDENELVAKAADWLLGRPLKIVAILGGAWILTLVLRRIIRRAVARMLVPPDMVMRRLDALGVASVEEELQERRISRATSIGTVAASTVTVIIATIALMSSARVLGVDLAPLIAGAGVMGVALGFGAQSLVKDCITGVFMLIEDQYGIGDTVDLGEASGTVERISLRATVLRGVDGTVWHVPNGQVVRVGNRSQLWSVALVDVEVAYSNDLDHTRDLLEATARRLGADEEWADDVLEAPQVLGVESLGAEGVVMRLKVKTKPGRQWALQRALREEIKSTFEAEGIVLPPRATAFRMEPPPDALL